MKFSLSTSKILLCVLAAFLVTQGILFLLTSVWRDASKAPHDERLFPKLRSIAHITMEYGPTTTHGIGRSVTGLVEALVRTRTTDAIILMPNPTSDRLPEEWRRVRGGGFTVGDTKVVIATWRGDVAVLLVSNPAMEATARSSVEFDVAFNIVAAQVLLYMQDNITVVHCHGSRTALTLEILRQDAPSTAFAGLVYSLHDISDDFEYSVPKDVLSRALPFAKWSDPARAMYAKSGVEQRFDQRGGHTARLGYAHSDAFIVPTRQLAIDIKAKKRDIHERLWLTICDAVYSTMGKSPLVPSPKQVDYFCGGDVLLRWLRKIYGITTAIDGVNSPSPFRLDESSFFNMKRYRYCSTLAAPKTKKGVSVPPPTELPPDCYIQAYKDKARARLLSAGVLSLSQTTAPIFLFVGKFTRGYSADKVVELANALRGTEAVVAVIGHGSEEVPLRISLQSFNAVILDTPELEKAYGDQLRLAASFAFVPSSHEIGSQYATEALYFGLTLVCSDAIVDVSASYETAKYFNSFTFGSVRGDSISKAAMTALNWHKEALGHKASWNWQLYSRIRVAIQHTWDDHASHDVYHIYESLYLRTLQKDEL